MYNILVTYTADAWDAGVYAFRSDRVLKVCTDEDLRERYGELDNLAIAELISFPCLFAYEEGRGDEVRLGWLTKIKDRGYETRLTFEFEEGLTPFSFDDIKKLTVALDLAGDLTTTHWAVKDVDLVPTLLKAGLLKEEDINRLPPESRVHSLGVTRPVTDLRVTPQIFRVPYGKPELDLVSVMMPFSMEFDAVFDAIKAACGIQNLRCQRADHIWDAPEVIQDVFSLIYRSHAVVCDFSGRNPNVFYEAGIAHTLGKTVVPIVQNRNDVPFDLGHIRYISYHDNAEGREALTAALADKLGQLAGT